MSTPTWSTAWASASGFTLSNNDRTAADTTKGNQPRWIMTEDTINIVASHGLCHYIEISVDQVGDLSNGKRLAFGMCTTEAAGTDIDSTGLNGRVNSWPLSCDGSADPTPAFVTANQVPFGLSIAPDWQFADGALVNDDRIGVLVNCGYAQSRIDCAEIIMWKNGVNIGTLHIPYQAHGIDGTDYRIGYESQTTTNTTTVTIIDEGSWLYAPNYPNLQSWSATIDTSVTPVDPDDLPCHMVYPPCRHSGTSNVNNQPADFGSDGHHLRYKLWGQDSGTDTGVLQGSKTHYTGKHYIEVYAEAVGSGQEDRGGYFGFFGKDDPWIGGGGNDTVWFDLFWGSWLDDVRGPIGANEGTNIGFGDVTAGDYLMIAVDFGTGDTGSEGVGDPARIWFGKNGTWHGGANPATPSGGWYVGQASNSTGKWYKNAMPWKFHHSYIFDNVSTDNIWQINFGAWDFNYTPPSGFTAWDSTPWPAGWGDTPSGWAT
jgi:hypothetical protein